ncbi:hypothetical protein HYI12_06855 [Acinetobacter sp. SwsAc3]|nr:hypothetical protein [Acinetobacter sp. SwsAc3]
MNKEEFQARITAAQAGKNTTFSELEKKKTLREQLESDLELFLTCGGEVNELPQGFSGELHKGWNNGEPKPQKTMHEIMAGAVSETHKKRARQKEDQATLAEIKALDRWCKERKGRGGDLCRELKVAHSFISQITQQNRP